jgi:glyoxylase-like metal-dependent hydrolase (beta-lactamase superfamily II)
VLIDPVFEQHGRDLSLIRELGIDLVASLDTHAHADHVTGSWLLQAATNCAIALAAAVGAENVTLPLRDGERVPFGGRHLEVRSTPGHTVGCLTYVLDDQSRAFTGDALLVRGCGRCDFQQGDPHALWASITGRILTLPDRCLLYPGHDYNGRGVTTVTLNNCASSGTSASGSRAQRTTARHSAPTTEPARHRARHRASGSARAACGGH